MCRNHLCQLIPNGGWHFSYFGDVEFIKNKIRNFSHQEFNNSTYLNDYIIKNRIKNSVDLYGRNIKITYIDIKDNLRLPPNIDYLLELFKSKINTKKYSLK